MREAPENVKYHGGFDPADPPTHREEDEECLCPECGLWWSDCTCPDPDIGLRFEGGPGYGTGFEKGQE